MRKANIVLITAISCSLLTSLSRAQDAILPVPVPATKLESFDTNVGIVIIRAATEIGVISTDVGTISVKCREITDTTSGRKERGIDIEITEKGAFKDRLLIDYDEISSLLKGMDYLSKLDVSVTSLNAFDAGYMTKGGFRIAALGNRRVGSIRFSVRDSRINMVPVLLSRDDMARFSNFMDLARKQLDGLGKEQ
jgi:hypothetical protein